MAWHEQRSVTSLGPPPPHPPHYPRPTWDVKVVMSRPDGGGEQRLHEAAQGSPGDLNRAL